MIKTNTSTNSDFLKKLKAEKREELRLKLKQKQTGLADQIRKMKMSKNYQGDVKKFVNPKPHKV